MSDLLKTFKNGIFDENPTFVQLIGMCPTLAVTTSLANDIGMGLSATAVLVLSNIVISLLRKLIPSKVRIAAYVAIIATFVTVIDLMLQAFVPALSESLGIFIPLIVVNCIILARRHGAGLYACLEHNFGCPRDFRRGYHIGLFAGYFHPGHGNDTAARRLPDAGTDTWHNQRDKEPQRG